MNLTPSQLRELNDLWEELRRLNLTTELPLSASLVVHDALVVLAPYRTRFHRPEPQ